ncbi:MAG: trimeric intracellular cation channel family protein [Reyranellaceae bacterium]
MTGEFLHGLQLLGVGVFALTGALAAARARLDIFGFALLAAVTGIGGGTLRDVLLDIGPVFWIEDHAYIVVCVAVAAVAFFAAPRLARGEKVILWADALGMALFCVLGAERARDAGATALVAVVMGVLTAAFGGIVRDVLCVRVPLMLRQEIYATAAAAGASLFVLLAELGAPQSAALLAGFLAAFVIRGAALIFHWSLPAHRGLGD